MLQAVANAFKIPDLRNKILYTLFILVVFRIVAHIPVAGVDQAALERLFQNNALLGMLNLFSGSALENFSVAAMGDRRSVVRGKSVDLGGRRITKNTNRDEQIA